MCIAKENLVPKKERSLTANMNMNMMNATVEANATATAASTGTGTGTRLLAWKRLFQSVPSRPKLSRKLVTSAKLNLNRYWHKFEELLSPEPQQRLLNNAAAAAAAQQSSPVSARFTLLPNNRVRPQGELQRQQANNNNNNNNNININNKNYNTGGDTDADADGDGDGDADGDGEDRDVNNYLQRYLIAKPLGLEKNLMRSGRYRHFIDDSLYHGVNLYTNNVTTTTIAAAAATVATATATLSNDTCPDCDATAAAIIIQRHRRCYRVTAEDQQNLDNEAMELIHWSFN